MNFRRDYGSADFFGTIDDLRYASREIFKNYTKKIIKN